MKIEKVALAIIINQKEEILLTQRFEPSNPSIHLKWQFPGGGVERNETLQNASIRETREETGLNIKLLSKYPKRILKRFSTGAYDLRGFLAEVVSGTIDVSLDDETNDIRWFSLDDVKKLDCLEKTQEMIELCLEDYGREFITHKK